MKRLVILLSIGMCGAAAADDAALLNCRAIPDSAKRLACYDAVAAKLAPAKPAAASPAPAKPAAAAAVAPPALPKQPTEQFGLEERVAETTALASIESHIPGVFPGWRPNDEIRLANGQVWQVTDRSSSGVQRQSPKVTVRRGALGAFYLDIEGDNRSPRVRRLQ